MTTLLERELIERVENSDDRRAFELTLSPKGKALCDELIPRLLSKERDILSCLTAQELHAFAGALDKIEQSLDLVQKRYAQKAGAY